MSMVGQVYDPEAVKLMDQAMAIANSMHPPGSLSENARREMALAILDGVADGETDAQRLATMAAARASNVASGASVESDPVAKKRADPPSARL
jgi:hypothetical protein